MMPPIGGLRLESFIYLTRQSLSLLPVHVFVPVINTPDDRKTAPLSDVSSIRIS